MVSSGGYAAIAHVTKGQVMLNRSTLLPLHQCSPHHHDPLLYVLWQDPTSKSLVFSQFSSSLEWLKHALPKHGFEFRTLTGSMSRKQRTDALKVLSDALPFPLAMCVRGKEKALADVHTR